MSTKIPDGALWVRDFTPGYLDSPSSDTLPMGATPDAKNSFLFAVDVLRRRAELGRREGSRLVLTTAITSEKCVDGLFEWRNGGTPTLLAVCNGSLYSVDPVAMTLSAAIGSGWTVGNPARLLTFRNDAFVFDGAQQKRWDGTTLYDVGSSEPTSLTNMVVGAGTQTGTYEALYTWYNQNRDRHSSPSVATAPLVLAGQGRTHTKPASAAPSWATHWGVWVRRTDTSELNYFFTAIVAIGTGSTTETVSDVVRQRAVVAPLPNSHDAPPGAWAILEEHKGYGIGILDGSDSFYVSEVGDIESWHPRNKFPTSRARGEYLKWGKAYGTEFLLGTPHATWRLDGDTVPFKPKPVHMRYGNVSQEACLEVNGKFYGWDRVKGPYVTDLVDWRPLGANRIDDFLDTVYQTGVSGIRAFHSERHSLIGWAVPTGNSTRRRTILLYHYNLDCWLPPMTGLEYGSIAEFTDSSGALNLYLGDYWGRIFQLFTGAKEGVPTTSPTDNVRSGAVLSATPSTVTLDVGSGSLYVTGSGLAGLPVAVKSSAGVWQWRTIKSNTSDTITIDTINAAAWETDPIPGSTVYVGGIEWFQWTPWIDFGIPHKTKNLQHLYIQAKSTSANHELGVRFRFNNDEGVVESIAFTFDVAQSAGIWGVSLWGEALWAETQRQMRKRKIQRSPLTAQIQFSNYLPDQDMKIPMWGLTADAIPGMEVPSV